MTIDDVVLTGIISDVALAGTTSDVVLIDTTSDVVLTVTTSDVVLTGITGDVVLSGITSDVTLVLTELLYNGNFWYFSIPVWDCSIELVLTGNFLSNGYSTLRFVHSEVGVSRNVLCPSDISITFCFNEVKFYSTVFCEIYHLVTLYFAVKNIYLLRH